MPDQAVVTALRDFFERDPHGCLTVYLFGSRDPDVAILWEATPLDPLEAIGIGLKVDLEDLLGRDLDVVVLDTASLDVAQRVIRDGQIILDRDRAARLRWEVKTRMLFLDLLPALRRYRRMSA